MTRAIASFTASVAYGRYRVRVRVLPTMKDVDRAYREQWRAERSEQVRGFFAPTTSENAIHVGTITIPAEGPLRLIVPHEVVHAVMQHHGSVDAADDEGVAGDVGYLTMRIFDELQDRLGLGV